MLNIGQYLKRERELRKIPLDYVANETKITTRYLQALENGEMDSLPGKVFVKGFIKSYAKSIGLSPEDVMLRYDDEAVDKPKPAYRLLQPVKVQLPSKSLLQHIRPFSKKLVFILIALLVMAMAAYFSL